MIAVLLFAGFVGALFSWFGWLDSSTSPFHGFVVSRLALMLPVLVVAALVALRLFRFPLLVL